MNLAKSDFQFVVQGSMASQRTPGGHGCCVSEATLVSKFTIGHLIPG